MIEFKDKFQHTYRIEEISSSEDVLTEYLRLMYSWENATGKHAERAIEGYVKKMMQKPQEEFLYAVNNLENGESVAMAQMSLYQPRGNTRVAYLHSRIVKPGWENKGFGGMLVDFRSKEARDKFHCTSAFVEASRGSYAAVRSIMKQGFIIPEESACYKTKFQLYKKLRGTNLDLPVFRDSVVVRDIDEFKKHKKPKNFVLSVDFEDRSMINAALQHDYSAIKTEGDINSSDKRLVFARLPEEFRNDLDWGFKKTFFE